jgi:hypothetical protein
VDVPEGFPDLDRDRTTLSRWGGLATGQQVSETNS